MLNNIKILVLRIVLQLCFVIITGETLCRRASLLKLLKQNREKEQRVGILRRYATIMCLKTIFLLKLKSTVY